MTLVVCVRYTYLHNYGSLKAYTYVSYKLKAKFYYNLTRKIWILNLVRRCFFLAFLLDIHKFNKFNINYKKFVAAKYKFFVYFITLYRLFDYIKCCQNHIKWSFYIIVWFPQETVPVQTFIFSFNLLGRFIDLVSNITVNKWQFSKLLDLETVAAHEIIVELWTEDL